MKTIGAFDAKTHLSRILADIEATHEEYVIQRRGKNIARLVPYDYYPPQSRAAGVREGFQAVRESQKPYKGSVRSLIDEGRKR